MTHAAAHAKLDELKRFEKNWDIIQAAHEFLANMPADIEFPAVVPGSSGNVQFEWNVGSRELELEIETPERVYYGRWDNDDDSVEEGTCPLADFARSIELIRWVLAGC